MALEEAQDYVMYHWQTCQAGIKQQQNLPMREQFQFVILHIIGILITGGPLLVRFPVVRFPLVRFFNAMY